MGGTTVSAPPPAPSIAPQLALIQAQQNAQNNAFMASLEQQPFFLQMARDLGTEQSRQSGKVLGAAQDLAGYQQDLGGNYLKASQALASQQSELGNQFLSSARGLASDQNQLGLLGLKTQQDMARGDQALATNILNLTSRTAPEAQNFNAAQVSKEAAELGQQSIAQERQTAQLFNPEAEQMRATMGKRIQDLTSGKGDQEWLNTLLKQGLMQSGTSGIPLTSSAGGAAYGDLSYEQKRMRDMQNLQIQQEYANRSQAEVQNAGNQGMALVQAKQAAEARNAAQRNAWMDKVLQQSGLLGSITSQAQQKAFDATQNYSNQSLAAREKLLGLVKSLGDQSGARQEALTGNAYELGTRSLGAQAGLLSALQNSGDRNLSTTGGLIGQLGQTSMGNLNSMMGMQNQQYGNLMGAMQAGQQQQYDYQKALYQGSVQNAASQNAASGSAMGAAGSAIGMIGMAALMCWVAREVYGQDDPAWMEFRNWLLANGSERRLAKYLKNGPKVAEYISTRPGWKNKLRTWMDRCRGVIV
jgi:hypothetical protein